MLSARDCLDYCDLTDEDVAIFAEQASIPKVAAAQIMCGMAQTFEGILALTRCLWEAEDRARQAGKAELAARAHEARLRFMATHPLTP
jgi:hypothetical protein